MISVVNPSDEEIRRCILQVLYPETNTMGNVRDIPEEALASIIGVEQDRVHSNVLYFLGNGFVLAGENGVRLTEKAVWAIRQHERTYCPYL